jgi:hypothetical protein
MDTPGGSGSYTPPPPPPPPSSGSTPPAAPSGGDIVYPQDPPKDPVLIAVLNLVVAGCLGYFMIGQKMKGIVAVIAWVVGLFFTCGTVSGLVSIVAAIDGYMQAQQLKAGFPVAQWTFFDKHQ